MIHELILKDPTEKIAPPEQVVRISAVADLAFISIEKYEEDSKKTVTVKVADIAVSLPALREAVQLLTHERDREQLREIEPNGHRGAAITGNRYVVAPL